MAFSPSPFPHIPSARKGTTFQSAIPTQIVSNEEFAPFGRTAAQARVERLSTALVEQTQLDEASRVEIFLRRPVGRRAALWHNLGLWEVL